MNAVPTPCNRPAVLVMRLLASALLACMAGACATPSTAAGDGTHAIDNGVTYVVVRHAEKASDDPRDPSLTEAGHARAARLATRLADEDIVAAYATEYRRTAQTLEPTVTAHGITLQTYAARLPATEFAVQLTDTHRNGTVVIAGHSNTVPDIVAALCACETQAMPETEYDRISTIHIDKAGRRNLHIEHDPAANPPAGH